jgi:glycosidase
MPTSLSNPITQDVLKAQPATTQTPSGTEIPYPYPSPADWRDHWIYFLLVDRFNNPTGPPSPNEYPCAVYQGGNFSGIKQQLPYLKKLGVGAIWLSPVLMNPQWFKNYWGGYGTLDFLRIESRFCDDPVAAWQNPAAGDAEFRSLVDEIHAQGMYVILDIVLNHTGDVFNYEGMRDEAPWNDTREYTIYWRDGQGQAQGAWTDIGSIQNRPADGLIWPEEFQRNDFFRRRGDGGLRGDFSRMKELVTEYLIPGTTIYPVRNHLITAYQYLMARFDLDGYRIDTLQYVEADFARVFGNAMREYALSIGKKNFFTFGEVWQDDDEARIAEFIGRNTEKDHEFIGVDAAIDFPMRKRLVDVCKGFAPPKHLADHFDHRLKTLRQIVSSHGDAGRHYVTFLDNHDLDRRFHNKQFPDQTKLALTCLLCMQGIPCIYYGTEQGLDGSGNVREYAREALWGLPDAFDEQDDLYTFISELSWLRATVPALRYGRQYFRPCSGDGVHFGHSPYKGGVIAFSRVLNDKEIVIVANTNTQQDVQVDVVVDKNLHPEGSEWEILFPLARRGMLMAGSRSQGDFRTIQVELAAMEFLVVG